MNRVKNYSKTIVDGIKFDSKAEADYYLAIKEDPDRKIVEIQPKVYLSRAKILYKPDFKIKDIAKNYQYYLEVKGFESAIFRLKRRLWIAYKNEELHVVSFKIRQKNKVKFYEFFTKEIINE